MNHAILITAYNNPEMLNRLVRQFQGANYRVYIHIDKKCQDMFRHVQSWPLLDNVSVISKVCVNWGGGSHLRAINELIALALNDSFGDRFHLLSGSDLRVRPLDEFDSYFEANSWLALNFQIKVGMDSVRTAEKIDLGIFI